MRKSDAPHDVCTRRPACGSLPSARARAHCRDVNRLAKWNEEVRKISAMENCPDQRVSALLEAAPPSLLGGDEALVFVDHSGRRARGVHLIGAVVVALCALWLVGVVSGMVGSGFPGGRLQLFHLQASSRVHPWRGNAGELVTESAATRERETDMVNTGSRAPCPAVRAAGNLAAAHRHAVYGSGPRHTGRAACSPKLPALHREGTRLT